MGNGMGSIYRIGGKKQRRKPFAVRVTKGYTDEGKQIYSYIGYYETQKEALEALSNYNENPYNIDKSKITFEEVFEKWSNEHYPTISESNIKRYNLSFNNYCKELHKMRFVDIRLSHLQGVLDDSNKAYPTKCMIRILLSQLSKYALKNDIVVKDYSQFLNVGKRVGQEERTPFTKEDIQKLWKNVDKLEWVDTVLILLYTGMRISELLDIKIENVHIENEKYPYMVGGNKTRAGINRRIPINKKILPLVQKYYEQNKNNTYLITNFKGEKMKYSNYRREKWDNMMEKLKMQYTPHCTRHSFISLLNSAGAIPLNIKRIVGHSSQDITEDVYTHKTLQELSETVNLI